MKTGWKFPEQAALARHAEMLIETGEHYEKALAYLRKGGMGLLDSMRVLSDATGKPLTECKNIVLRSAAWR